MKLLIFGRGNAKLDKSITTFSLPAGWTCPGAAQCLARANRATGKLQDGKEQTFRCFAASAEAVYPSVRKSRWANFEALKGLNRSGMASLINSNLPSSPIVRIHVSGDFFSEAYFLAWCDVARANPKTRFYAYTKSIHYWARNEAQVPSNLVLTGSNGGRYDSKLNGFKSATVVYSEEQAKALGLEIDHDDSHAYEGKDSFALLLHGMQPKGTESAKALSALKHSGHTGYSRKP